VLRQLATHDAAVECLYWAQEGQEPAVRIGSVFFCFLRKAENAENFISHFRDIEAALFISTIAM
jgi:hypothetical protein